MVTLATFSNIAYCKREEVSETLRGPMVTCRRRRRDYRRRHVTSPKLASNVAEMSPRLPGKLVVTLFRDVSGDSASNLWFHKSPESPQLISCGNRSDASASEIPPLVDKLNTIFTNEVYINEHYDTNACIKPESKRTRHQQQN